MDSSFLATLVAVSPSCFEFGTKKAQRHSCLCQFSSSFFLSLSLQRSIRRAVQIPVHVRRPVISPATGRSSPWSKSPARARLAISPGNTTSPRTTSGGTLTSPRQSTNQKYKPKSIFFIGYKNHYIFFFRWAVKSLGHCNSESCSN